ncbi:MAG: PAS domain-containing protein [Desulfovibrionaceae bacterium]|nr:PAS domain-containing protein [Desulfovibrionaceae bacterium]
MGNMCRKPRMLEEVSHFFLSDLPGQASSRKISGGTHDTKAPPVGVIIVDKNKIMRFANPIARRMLGLEAETYLGQLFNFFIEVNEVSEVSIVRENRKPGIAAMQIRATEWEDESVYFAVMRDVTRSWRKKSATPRYGGERGCQTAKLIT